MNNQNIRRDVEILKDGPICMYHNNGILNEDFSWFSDNNFEVFDMNCRTWTKNNLHKKIKEVLFFPDYYGENLDAFHDCLGDMLNTKYRGLILIFRSFDVIVEQHRPTSEGILASIARTSREWLIDGHKLICLIQSNDPDLNFPELGGLSPAWNGAEWLDENRR
ncbi:MULTISPECIES: barstar family protein [unclassified Imperialibacter]|uniref:barstar family protein n=1 Tax=unclassified Imperialibacter TaxID=2629706 RepID=UPI00125F55F5|nr:MULTISPECIES: barstar family protein [unclassified Imperialibacter]